MMRMRFCLAVALGLLVAGSVAVAQVEQTAVEECVAGWPESASAAARDMVDKYGTPDLATTMMIVWLDRDPWHKIVLYAEPVQHNFPMPHEDVLEQAVYYNVPVEKFSELAAFDGSVIVDRTKGTIAARCDKEAANFLALNLAVDIIEDRMTVEEARQSYAEHIQALMAGEERDYLMGLQFEPQSPDVAAAPDEAVIEQ